MSTISPVRNRIKELRQVKASELIPNPKNWRHHPDEQQTAMQGILDEVGYADAVVAYETDAGLMLLNGHLRSDLAQDAEIPVLVLDVNEEEADKILASFDFVSTLATIDEERLQELTSTITFDSQELDNILSYMVQPNRS